MQAKTLVQIGFDKEAWRIFRQEDDLEHASQAELATSDDAESLAEMRRRVHRQLSTAAAELGPLRERRARIGLGRAEHQRYDYLVNEMQTLKRREVELTRALGEGLDASGQWHGEQNPKGLAARCALVVKKARGADVSLRVDHPGHQCVQCQQKEHLALCYYCAQPLCRDHRLLVGRAKVDEQGRRKGGASCSCTDKRSCIDRQSAQKEILGMGTEEGKGAAASASGPKGKKGVAASASGRGSRGSGKAAGWGKGRSSGRKGK